MADKTLTSKHVDICFVEIPTLEATYYQRVTCTVHDLKEAQIAGSVSDQSVLESLDHYRGILQQAVTQLEVWMDEIEDELSKEERSCDYD